MASQTINVPMPPDGFEALKARVREAARSALVPAAGVVQSAVLDFTPRWKGGLQSRILIKPEDGGDTQTVYTEGVVAQVMEVGAQGWTRFPPERPIKEWVEGKLGLSGKEASRATFLIRRKIFREGIRVPLKHDGRGAMFRRGFERMRSTRAHFLAFAAAFRSRKISG